MESAHGNTGSDKHRRKFVNSFANGVSIDTDLDDELVCNHLRLDAFETLHPGPPILLFSGTLLGTTDENVRDVDVLGCTTILLKLGTLRRAIPVFVVQSYDTDADMVLSTSWMNEDLGSFQDDEVQKLFGNSDPNSAVPFKWESGSRPQKI